MANEPAEWFTPLRVLFVLCVINMLNYIDRGAIASNGVNGRQADDSSCTSDCSTGSGIQGDFNLSNFEDGLLPAAFMVGLLLSSPLFAWWSKKVNPLRLIGSGLTVWTLALIGCAVSVNLATMLVSRMFVGVGEASFISLAAPFIDDHAPAGKTTQWLALFYMCIPTGYALGYVFGGTVPYWFGSWRAAFWLEASLMVPFALLALLCGHIPLQGKNSKKAEVNSSLKEGGLLPTSPSATLSTSILDDARCLAGNRTYVTNVAGYTAYTFVIGAYAFWGPKAAQQLFHMADADTLFGAITVVAGIGGTLAGGLALDSMGGTVPNAFKLMGTVTFIGGLFCLAAFFAPNESIFIPLLLLGEFFVFAIQGPANIVSMQCVPPDLRALSIAGATVVTHILGDVPSPPILGALQDFVGSWRISMAVFTAIFVPCAIIWASGSLLPVPMARVTAGSSSLDDSTEAEALTSQNVTV